MMMHPPHLINLLSAVMDYFFDPLSGTIKRIMGPNIMRSRKIEYVPQCFITNCQLRELIRDEVSILATVHNMLFRVLGETVQGISKANSGFLRKLMKSK